MQSNSYDEENDLPEIKELCESVRTPFEEHFLEPIEKNYNLILTETNSASKAKALLTLCARIQKKNLFTESAIELLLKIYYDVYCIFKMPMVEEPSQCQEIIDDYFLSLKHLSTVETLNPKYNELIHLLFCGILQSALKLKVSISNSLLPASPELYFNQAVSWYYKSNTLHHDWTNTLRFSILKFVLFSNTDETFTLNDIILALIAKGDENARHWTKSSDTILRPSERQLAYAAQGYYDLVIWLKNVGLSTEPVLKHINSAEQKHAIITAHLQKSILKENTLLILPLTKYIKNNNPENTILTALLKQEGFKKQVSILNEGFFKKSVAEKLALLQNNDLYFLLDVCNQGIKTYPKEVRALILVELYYQIYNPLHASDKLSAEEFAIVSIVQEKILKLPEAQDKTSILYEICHLLLFRLKVLESKNEITADAKIHFFKALEYFHAGQKNFFKSKWAQALRISTLILYSSPKEFLLNSDPLRIETDINKILVYLKYMSSEPYETPQASLLAQQAEEILQWAKCVQLNVPSVALEDPKDLLVKKIQDLSMMQQKATTTIKTASVKIVKTESRNTQNLVRKDIPMQTLENIQNSLEETKENSDIIFEPSEKKVIFEALLSFLDAGNDLNPMDACILLGQHMNMNPKMIELDLGSPPVTTWVRAEMLNENMQWRIRSAENAALFYHPVSEGECYFSPHNQEIRRRIKIRNDYHALSLEGSDGMVRHHVQAQKKALHALSNTSFRFLHADVLSTLSEKIKLNPYSEPLKTYLLSYINSPLALHTPLSSIEERYQHISIIQTDPISKAQSLLILCDHVQRKEILSEDTILFLINIYHEIYCIFKEENKTNTLSQEILLDYFVCLKALLEFQNTFHRYNEVITLLICGAFKNSFYSDPSIDVNQVENPETYFKQAVASATQWYSEKQDVFHTDWTNVFRNEILRFCFFSSEVESYAENLITFDLIRNANKLVGNCLTADSNIILPLKKHSEFAGAISLYSIYLWLNQTAVFPITAFSFGFTEIQNRTNEVNQLLQKSKLAENMLLTEPLFNYLNDGNPENVFITRLLNQHDDYKASCKLLQAKQKKLKKGKRSPYQALKEEEFDFLIEVSNLDGHHFTPPLENIILLDLYYKIYKHVTKSDKISIFSYATAIEKNILKLSATHDKNDILNEICNILLFHFTTSSDNSRKRIMTGKSQQYFLNAIRSTAPLMFKSKWAQELREEALTVYAIGCHIIPKLHLYADSIEKMLKHIALIAKLSPKNQTEVQYIHEAKTILKWAQTVALMPTLPTLSDSKTLQESAISEAPMKTKKDKKSKDKSPNTESEEIPTEAPQQSNLQEAEEKKKQAEALEAQNLLEKQKRAETRRLKEEALKKELEAKEAAEQLEREKEKKTREEARKQRELQEAEEAAKKKAEQEERTLRQAEKRAAKQAEEARIKAEKLKLIAQEQAEKEAIEAEALRQLQLQEIQIQAQKERELAQLALEAQEKQIALITEKNAALEITLINPLREHHNQRAEERKQIIEDRPFSFLKYLENFSLDNFSGIEMSRDNLKTLKSMDALLEDAGTLELFGSYVVFIASLRLGFPIDKIRSPSDIDMRIKLKGNSLSNYTTLVNYLLSLGFELKFPLKPGQSLEKYIQKRIQNGGFMSLSKSPLAKDPQSKEMELSIIFPAVYIANTNPFSLLKHTLLIKNNQASFNGDNIKLNQQLGNDIIENNFQCNMLEPLDLDFKVHNFFPRAMKNIECWNTFFNMDRGSMHEIINNLSFITDYFSIRFYSQKHIKDCYLEIAGLIHQGYFLKAASNLITEGFLQAFFKVLNVESMHAYKEELVDPKEITAVTQQIKLGLEKHVAQDPKSYTELKEKSEVCEMLYKKVIQLLGTLEISQHKKLFLLNCQKEPRSILFDSFTVSKPCTKPNTSVSRTFVPPAPALNDGGVPAAPTLVFVPAAPTMPMLLPHTWPGPPPVAYSFNQTMIQQQPLLPNPPTARARPRVRYIRTNSAGNRHHG